MNRRQLLKAAAGAAALSLCSANAAPKGPTRVDASRLPRWRGFNLLEKFTAASNAPFQETDFQWMADWGFDFVRLPLSYHCWASPDDWLNLKEPVLKEIDQAVQFGRKHKVHVNINFHRAPGYCVNPPQEPLDLWTDEKALDACAFHWAHFAKRYKGIPSTEVSFDLLNEPGDIRKDSYIKVVTRLVQAIRAEDPNRLIIADGLRWGRVPVLELASLKIGQSTRGYDPMRISHHKASWINGSDRWPEPTWPLRDGETSTWGKEQYRKEYIQPWKALEREGSGVHVGEWGAFNQTPHPVALAWMRDLLELWKEAGWGWAMWNFRGAFGVLDSGRKDVQYEDFHGHKLDRKMLDLIRAN